MRAAASSASSVCLRVTSCCASACASGPACAARASAAEVWVSVSARRRDVALGVDLDLLGLGLADRRLLVRAGLGHAGIALDDGELLLAEQLDVAGLVGDRLDGEGVDLQP
ncbi:MAG: hypothetical protein ACRDGV_03610 [Candidatus Limnocylindria bacterium]